MREKIPVARVVELFVYDPDAGRIAYRVATRRNSVGDVATVIRPQKKAKPWMFVYVDGLAFGASTVAWILAHGEKPKRQVRFVNGDTTDIRLSNLRLDEPRLNRITAADVRDRFDYDAINGRLVLRVPTRKSPAGTVVGHRPGEYGAIRLNGRNYQTHVLVWAHQKGEFPTLFVDHINGDKSDNRIENLRLATNSQNLINCHKPRTSQSGVRGVIYCKGKKKFKAEIGKDGKCHFLGHFETKEEAIAARRKAEVAIYGEFSPHARKRVA